MAFLLLFIFYALVLSIALRRAGYRHPSLTAPYDEPPGSNRTRILIVGATGGTGRKLVRQALERGYSVTALVRDPSRLDVDHSELTVIQGDVLDEDSVETAVRGLYFWDKTRQERIIAGSGVEWVIVRPGVLTNGSKRRRYRHGRHVGSFLWTVRISRADVADFMLNQIEFDTHLGSAVGVCW